MAPITIHRQHRGHIHMSLVTNTEAEKAVNLPGMAGAASSDLKRREKRNDGRAGLHELHDD